MITSAMKLTLDMGEEIRDQNRFISGMDNDFEKTYGFLSSSMTRLKRIAKDSPLRLSLYLFLFALFVFFIIWIIMKTR